MTPLEYLLSNLWLVPSVAAVGFMIALYVFDKLSLWEANREQRERWQAMEERRQKVEQVRWAMNRRGR